MPGRNHLFVPGPTNIPERIRRAMDVPLEDHRAGDFPDFAKPLFTDIKKIFPDQRRSGLHLQCLGHRRLGSGHYQYTLAG